MLSSSAAASGGSISVAALATGGGIRSKELADPAATRRVKSFGRIVRRFDPSELRLRARFLALLPLRMIPIWALAFVQPRSPYGCAQSAKPSVRWTPEPQWPRRLFPASSLQSEARWKVRRVSTSRIH